MTMTGLMFVRVGTSRQSLGGVAVRTTANVNVSTDWQTWR